jgi:hypothetical protein
MRDKQLILKASRYENKILELIELQLRNDNNSLTQSDLQGAVMALVMRMLDEPQLPA